MQLSWSAIVEIAIHIGPAERPFNRVDGPILIPIEFLKMVMGQLRSVRIRNSCARLISARIIALWVFQHTVVHQIGSWLHDRFRHPLSMKLHVSKASWTRRLKLCLSRIGSLLNGLRLPLRWGRLRALWNHRLGLSQCSLSLLLNYLRLPLSFSESGALLGRQNRRLLPLSGLLFSRLGGGISWSRLLCFLGCRGRLPDRSREYGHDADRPKYNAFDDTPAHTPPDREFRQV